MDVSRVGAAGGAEPGPSPEAGPRPIQPGDILTARVLATEGRTARVSVAGNTVDVQTAVPLSPGDELSLKVARGPGGQIQLQVMALQGKGSLLDSPHVAELLEKMGMPTDKATVAAARALLQESGSVEPQQVRDLARLLATLRTPAEQAAATFLIARNLPATAAAIALVAGRPGDPTTSGKRIADRLEALRKVAPKLFEALQGLDLFETGADAGTEAGATRGTEAGATRGIEAGATQGMDAKALAEAIARLARGLNPLEAEILAFLRDGEGDLAERLESNLSAILERHAAEAPAGELAREVRFQQLASSATARRPDPAEVRVPLVFGKQTGELTVQKWPGNAKDPAGHARVVLRLDMDRLGPLTVDLMYARGQVGGRLTARDAGIRDFLAARLDQLTSGLRQVGVGVGHLEVGIPQTTQAETQPGRFDVRM